MPLYEYTALDARGKKRWGTVEAESREAARRRIRAGQLYPVEIAESRARMIRLCPIGRG